MKDAVYAGVASESGPSSPGHHWAEQGPGAPHAEAGDSVLPKGLGQRSHPAGARHPRYGHESCGRGHHALEHGLSGPSLEGLRGAGGVGSRRLPAAHLPARVGAHNDHRNLHMERIKWCALGAVPSSSDRRFNASGAKTRLAALFCQVVLSGQQGGSGGCVHARRARSGGHLKKRGRSG